MKEIISRIKKILPKKIETRLFLFSFIYLLFLGIILTYNYKITDNYNLLFDLDTGRVFIDATQIAASHYRVNVHPLFILFIQPLCLILNGIVLNKNLSIIILLSLSSSLTVLLIYKLLNKLGKNNRINILTSLIYLFSFSNIIFTSSPETYSFASLFLLLLWYYYIDKKDKLNIYSYIILVLLGIMSFAFTLTNICIFMIVLFLLFIDKKIDLKISILVTSIVILSVIGLNITQKLIWNNTPFFFLTNVREETTNYGNNISLTNIKNVIKNDYYNSIISSDIYLSIKYGNNFNNQNYVITFSNMNIINILLLSVFYLSLIVLLIRNFKKNKLLNTGLLLGLLFNSLLHTIYGNDSTFIYSLHFLYLIILLFGVNYNLEDNTNIKKYLNIFIPIFLVLETIINNYIFIKVLSFVEDNIAKNYLLNNLGLLKTLLIEISIIIIISIIIFITIKVVKTIKKEKNKEKKYLLYSSIILLVIAIESIFIMLNSIEANNKFLIFKIDNKEDTVVPKTKLDYSNKSFKEYFKKELDSLKEYQSELDEFKNNHSVEPVNYMNWSDYYYFGLGNRKKLMYQKNKLIDIETKEVIKEFDEKEHYIIPNIYTVIIETTDSKYIKIYEDENGLYYKENDKQEKLDSTKIDLYKFDNQKYFNIKKELYGELLFNIKDSVIYPNIIVYDKPWYRDAAITCMVLKQTNNTNLISNWVNNITEIYDLQNAANKETDNLGELLYILSTQEELNNSLIDKIEQEAEANANSNPNGYYLYGTTDFGNQYLYQNLWYKLGIESVGRKYKFDLDSIPEDGYSKMAWWSNYNNNDTNPYESSVEYPYLSYAAYHKINNGTLPFNDSIYPLSWEINASQAKYDNYLNLDNEMARSRISPIHSWAGAELLLLLLDETNDLDFK